MVKTEAAACFNHWGETKIETIKKSEGSQIGLSKYAFSILPLDADTVRMCNSLVSMPLPDYKYTSTNLTLHPTIETKIIIFSEKFYGVVWSFYRNLKQHWVILILLPIKSQRMKINNCQHIPPFNTHTTH